MRYTARERTPGMFDKTNQMESAFHCATWLDAGSLPVLDLCVCASMQKRRFLLFFTVCFYVCDG